MVHWQVTPEALYWTAKFLHERYPVPMYITENGTACMDWVHEDGKVHDPQRVDYTSRYLKQVRRAIEDGVDLRGYFHWSIMDNFEWAEGYRQRFGLIYVDFPTGKRTPKDSYDWYQQVIASNGEALGK
jgi:beta-glucosidase